MALVSCLLLPEELPGSIVESYDIEGKKGHKVQRGTTQNWYPIHQVVITAINGIAVHLNGNGTHPKV